MLTRPIVKIIDGTTYAFEVRFDFKILTGGNADYKLWHVEYDPDKEVTYIGSDYTPMWYTELICIYHMLLYTNGYDKVFNQLDGKPLGSDDRREVCEDIMRFLAKDDYERFNERRISGEQ